MLPWYSVSFENLPTRSKIYGQSLTHAYFFVDVFMQQNPILGRYSLAGLSLPSQFNIICDELQGLLHAHTRCCHKAAQPQEKRLSSKKYVFFHTYLPEVGNPSSSFQSNLCSFTSEFQMWQTLWQGVSGPLLQVFSPASESDNAGTNCLRGNKSPCRCELYDTRLQSATHFSESIRQN